MRSNAANAFGVVAELEVRVADDAVHVRVIRLLGETTRALRAARRETVKREVRRREHPARFVVLGIASERGREHALGFHRSSAVTGRARLTKEDVAER